MIIEIFLFLLFASLAQIPFHMSHKPIYYMWCMYPSFVFSHNFYIQGNRLYCLVLNRKYDGMVMVIVDIVKRIVFFAFVGKVILAISRIDPDLLIFLLLLLVQFPFHMLDKFPCGILSMSWIIIWVRNFYKYLIGVIRWFHLNWNYV